MHRPDDPAVDTEGFQRLRQPGQGVVQFLLGGLVALPAGGGQQVQGGENVLPLLLVQGLLDGLAHCGGLLMDLRLPLGLALGLGLGHSHGGGTHSCPGDCARRTGSYARASGGVRRRGDGGGGVLLQRLPDGRIPGFGHGGVRLEIVCGGKLRLLLRRRAGLPVEEGVGREHLPLVWSEGLG